MRAKYLTLSGLGLALAASAVIASAATPTAEGKQLVNSHSCTMCHAKGGAVKPLSAYASESASRLKAIILDPKKALGASAMMPAYQGKLTEAQLDEIVAYIKAGAE